MMKDFSTWIEYKGASEGSGRSEKIWLENPETKEIGLFKFPKSNDTTEHLSEKISTEIAKLIGVECMEVDIGKYNSRVGSLSHIINKEGESLIEGVRLINRYYPNYNPITMYDIDKKEYYSMEMVLKSLQEYEFQKEFLRIPLFDFLIGNTDRHQNNWAILQKDDHIRLCPLYDNGSSLCCYIHETRIDSYLGNDKVRFNSLVDSKSKSRIRVHQNIKKEPSHIQVLRYLCSNYKGDIVHLAEEICKNINEVNIELILNEYNDIISENRKELITRFLLEKVKILNEEIN